MVVKHGIILPDMVFKEEGLSLSPYLFGCVFLFGIPLLVGFSAKPTGNRTFVGGGRSSDKRPLEQCQKPH